MNTENSDEDSTSEWQYEEWGEHCDRLVSREYHPASPSNSEFRNNYLQRWCVYDELTAKAIQDFSDKTIYVNNERAAIQSPIYLPVFEGLQKFLVEPQKQFPFLASTCPFCRVSLFSREHRIDCEEYLAEEVGALEYCANCRYWRWHHLESGYVKSPFLGPLKSGHSPTLER